MSDDNDEPKLTIRRITLCPNCRKEIKQVGEHVIGALHAAFEYSCARDVRITDRLGKPDIIEVESPAIIVDAPDAHGDIVTAEALSDAMKSGEWAVKESTADGPVEVWGKGQMTEASIIRRVQDISTLAASSDFEAAAVLKAQLHRDFIALCAELAEPRERLVMNALLRAIRRFAQHIKTLDLIVFPAREPELKRCTGTLVHDEFTPCPVHDR